MELTQDYLKEVLNYSPDTGLFVWKIAKRKVVKGGIAGCLKKGEGYVVICIDGTTYYAHRLAWFYINGVWPKGQIDHKNGERSDNRFSNLREASPKENGFNNKVQNNNTSGYKGAYLDKRVGRWKAQIQVKGKQLHLGMFPTPEQAGAAYELAASKYFGDFKRISSLGGI